MSVPGAVRGVVSKRVVRLDFCTCMHVNVQVASPFIVHAVLDMYIYTFSTSTL